jgi:hypothetical protein
VVAKLAPKVELRSSYCLMSLWDAAVTCIVTVHCALYMGDVLGSSPDGKGRRARFSYATAVAGPSGGPQGPLRCIPCMPVGACMLLARP